MHLLVLYLMWCFVLIVWGMRIAMVVGAVWLFVWFLEELHHNKAAPPLS
jgi:fatty acid desaturase